MMPRMAIMARNMARGGVRSTALGTAFSAALSTRGSVDCPRNFTGEV